MPGTAYQLQQYMITLPSRRLIPHPDPFHLQSFTAVRTVVVVRVFEVQSILLFVANTAVIDHFRISQKKALDEMVLMPDAVSVYLRYSAPTLFLPSVG